MSEKKKSPHLQEAVFGVWLNLLTNSRELKKWCPGIQAAILKTYVRRGVQ